MRHFYQRALIEQRMGPQADWSVVDALMLKTLAAAEKVARYKHAQLSSVRLAGDISGKMDDVSLDELLVTVKQEWAKLSPLIDLDAVEEPEPQGIANRLPPPKGHYAYAGARWSANHRIVSLGSRGSREGGGNRHLQSITLSARTNNASGTVMPSALAVLRLITSSNLVGCSTGMSATLIPWKSWMSCLALISRTS